MLISAIAGGDTNCFALDRGRQADKTSRACCGRAAQPRTGARHGGAATRTRAPGGHALLRADDGARPRPPRARLAGAVGVDAPRRYDVLAAAARVVAAGYLHTPESDHDGAWAALEY